MVQASRVSKELSLKGGTGYVERYPSSSTLTSIPRYVISVQPRLAMEHAYELGLYFGIFIDWIKSFNLWGGSLTWSFS